MSIIRAIRGIVDTWRTEELERLLECLDQQENQDSFYNEVVDVIRQEIQGRRSAEGVFDSRLVEKRDL